MLLYYEICVAFSTAVHWVLRLTFRLVTEPSSPPFLSPCPPTSSHAHTAHLRRFPAVGNASTPQLGSSTDWLHFTYGFSVRLQGFFSGV